MRKFPVLTAIVIVALLSGAARALYRDAGWWPIKAATGVALGSLPSGVKQSELNVLIITLDTTRADRLGAYGYRVQTPNLDGLAGEGVLFEQTESVTPLTLPAHGSLFTGRFPPSHGVRGNGGFFSDADHTTLAEVLKERGFQTGGFVGAYVLDSTWGLDQGFDTYVDGFDAPKFKWRSPGHLQRRADEVIDSALAWLDHAASSRFFAWLHFYDPHAPYEPPEPYAAMHVDEPYVGEIGFVDAQIGRVLAFLHQRDLVDRTIVVVVHGTYAGPWGVQITPVLQHRSGQPLGRTFSTGLNYADNVRILAEPIGTRRMDNITILDVRVEKAFRLAGRRGVAGFVDVFNLLNANPEQNTSWSSGSSFLRPLSIVPPRLARIGVKLEW